MNIRLSCCALLLCLTVFPALADAPRAAVVARDGYLRIPPPGVRQAAAFVVLENRDDHAHALVRVSTPQAARAELHTHVHEAGRMKMVRVERLSIPPRGRATLEPGGHHIMLFEVRPGVHEGARVPFTLEFEDGSVQTLDFGVRSLR